MSVGFALATLSAIASGMSALIGIVFAIAFITETLNLLVFMMCSGNYRRWQVDVEANPGRKKK